MKNKVVLLILALGFVQYSCSNKEAEKVSIGTLVNRIDEYQGKLVETEGTVIHVCGVDLRKLKLKSDDGLIIKVVPIDSTDFFDKNLKKKKLRITGIVKENRIERSYVDKVEKEKTLLCHVDHKPCKDLAWVNKKIESGTADKISALAIQRLRDKMAETGKDYVSVVTVMTRKVEVIK
jgi:hypothetical protein